MSSELLKTYQFTNFPVSLPKYSVITPPLKSTPIPKIVPSLENSDSSQEPKDNNPDMDSDSNMDNTTAKDSDSSMDDTTGQPISILV